MGMFSNYEKQVARADWVKLPGTGVALKLSNIFKRLNISKRHRIKTILQEKKGRPDGIVG